MSYFADVKESFSLALHTAGETAQKDYLDVYLWLFRGKISRATELEIMAEDSTWRVLTVSTSLC